MIRRVFNYIGEVLAVYKNIKYLGYLIAEYAHREEHPINKKIKIAQVPWKVASKGYDKKLYHVTPEDYPLNESDPTKESIYINGIMTGEYETREEAKQLSDFFGKPFTIFWNKSNGLFEDIYDCLRMKVGNKSDRSSKTLCKYITKRVEGYNIKKIFIVGYSQGSIIACHAIERLPKHIRDRVEINLLTIGSAQDSLHTYSKKGSALHICHINDFITRIGPLHYENKNVMKGQILKVPKDTHDFKTYMQTLKTMRTIDEKDHKLLTAFKNSL